MSGIQAFVMFMSECISVEADKGIIDQDAD